MIIKLKVSEKNEATAYPYWLIIDPRQMMKPDIYKVSSMITGPYFSREEAQEYLDDHKYKFSERARVFCHSGYTSSAYRKAIERAPRELKNIKIGSKVNYHSIIGEPPTQRNMTVWAGPELAASGDVVVWLEGKVGYVLLEAVSLCEDEE